MTSPPLDPTPTVLQPSWKAIEAALRQAPVAVAVLMGPEQRFASANDHYWQLAGRQGTLGKTWAEVFPELAGTEAARRLAEVYATGQGSNAKSMWVQLNRGGRRLEECFFRFNIEPMFDDAGRVEGVLVVGIEVTDEVRALAALESAYRERQKAVAELRNVSRAKEEFLAMLVHELRDPVSPIVTALELMKMRGTADTSHEQAVIRRQIERLTRLLDDLVGASGMAGGRVSLQREPLELGQFVEKVIAQMRHEFEERGQQLVVDTPRTGLACYADTARISQAITNVLSNASRYSPRGGRIEVSVFNDAGCGVVRVKDDGVGIAPDVMPRIFDLFFQGPSDVDRSHGGLGVGLPIARNLIEMHGGSITATSPGVGAGAEFTIRIPLVSRAEIEAKGAPAPMHTAAADRHRVLIVDDNVDAGEALGAFLAMEGHDVLVAATPEEALQKAPDFEPDIALLDIGLPGMSGHELGERLRALLSPHPCRMVAITGYGQEHDRKRSAEAGFAAHLIKPVDHDRLVQIIASDAPSAHAPA